MHDGTDRDKSLAQGIFMQDLAQDIRVIALPTVLELAPPTPGSPPPRHPLEGPHTVRENLYPNVVKLQLISRGGRLELIHGHHTNQSLDEGKPIMRSELKRLGIEDIASLPTYSDSEVLLLSCFEGGANAYDATIVGGVEKFVCKLSSDFFRRAFLRELEILAKIQRAKMNLGRESRVSVLRGISPLRLLSRFKY